MPRANVSAWSRDISRTRPGRWRPRISTRYGYVSDIFIRPEARGSGLAQVLLDAIAAHLHAADPTLTRLRVNVLAVNAIARRSYEKAGFTPYEVMYERLIRPGGQ